MLSKWGADSAGGRAIKVFLAVIGLGVAGLCSPLQALGAEILPSNAWSRVAEPSPGPPQAIGFYSHGCLVGGAPLPIDGVGYEAIRLARHRNFGHPELIDYVESLGRLAQGGGLARFLVGDAAQPRGGPLPYGHLSHQIGLDVDIWFTFDPKPTPPAGLRPFPELGSMLNGAGKVDPARFGSAQVRLLQLAAADPRVDRIFVNPAIKRALCRGFAGATVSGKDWLHRLSPWWGHDDHFHVRLFCPADSPECEPQKPLAPGDGCDADLDSWGKPRPEPVKPQAAGPPAPPPPPRNMPAACAAVLTAP